MLEIKLIAINIYLSYFMQLIFIVKKVDVLCKLILVLRNGAKIVCLHCCQIDTLSFKNVKS